MTPTPHAGIPAPAAEWAEVRRLAEAATAGPWMYPVGGAVVSLPARKSVFFGEATVPDMRFAAAANPSTVLRLLAERDRLREAAIATLRDYHLVAFDSGHDHPVEECHLPLFKERVALFAAPRDAGAGLDVERLRNVVYDALRAEIRRDNEQPMHVLAEHIAENAAAAYKALQTPGAPGGGDGE